ncbi:MAG: amidophosphoribosyltransferase [Prevotella ruminicola]|uniref:Amidophosphoribosyltransferase n=1 Tax=Xylanibacter ruminicola TaxID=839 RepID=A0A9D5P2G0_XYLRU|nr:amidophosphoribosyltransferase [Xylanibacter ruminicola]
MEQLKHECGVAMIRLLKPLDYYEKKYGTWAYGFNKLYLMMEKQHNRGQEGAGIASVNLTNKPGTEYMFREKAEGKNAITEIFSRVTEEMKGELLMGHLRYSTTGKSGLTFVHPFLRRNNWRAKNLCLCGNFNMTNIDEVFQFLTAQGQSPRIYGDSYITLELMGHRLDREVERLYQEATAQGLTGTDITSYIDDHIQMANVLRTTMQHYDGGYVMCGLTGSGEMFAVRDPWGIRPAFYYRDNEIIALASERPVLQTTFDIDSTDVHELLPGQALIVHKNGESQLEQIMPAQKLSACSFERIYFSRGSDCDIYQERKRLGEQLTQPILKAIDGDVSHSVFSYIPNTAEVAFYGMTDGFRKMHGDVRTEKVVWKDIKLRTFITDNSERNDLAAHVYDISYGSLQAGVDNLVIIDDSIVRGTTLKESIFKILDRLHPKKIVMVSSSPQIRYPDYYGIDMARLEEFCAFRATMALIEERGMWQLVNDTYLACKAELAKEREQSDACIGYAERGDRRRSQLEKPKEQMKNCVRAIYEPFTVDEINKKIVEMLRPTDMQAPIELVFQSIEGLHKACPNHPGDWYFTGHYPTPGGVKLVNQAFINYVDKTTKK